MALASRAFKKITQRAWTRVMDRIGGRLVSRMADTSADAPNAYYKPKRDLYARMQAEASGQASSGQAAPAPGEGEPTPQ